MDDENSMEMPPICPVCGLPVTERYRRKPGYKHAHGVCERKDTHRREHEREHGRRMRAEAELLDARSRVDRSARALIRAVEERNRTVRRANQAMVEECYWRVRLMIGVMSLTPMDLVGYREEWIVALARDIGSNGMGRIADLTGWKDARPWLLDPDIGSEGTARLVAPWPDIGPDDWIGYTADLDHMGNQGRAIDMVRLVDRIWNEDHHGTNRSDHGWWSLENKDPR
ncbi:hypothetical protein BISA_1884 [Bifidobacterium saguini DSM 23967]|uniref:Uncharacterized protein n=1 Tax=Bifidobacterium saguini DSM 23967 TaxID=1437607 RepID=A0A087D6Y3_9BIFI|nr:hypothetical protein [Bifidobacterium saguini]KFI91283.1 hypothetical protein BISA_1884 [Bifidobacterium saguini DSM 23967]